MRKEVDLWCGIYPLCERVPTLSSLTLTLPVMNNLHSSSGTRNGRVNLPHAENVMKQDVPLIVSYLRKCKNSYYKKA